LFAELSIKKELSKKEILKLLYKNAKDLDLNFEKLEGCRTQFTLFNAYRQIVEQSGHGEHDFSKMSASKSWI
jgi:CRISPR-associated endonuclease Csn1